MWQAAEKKCNFKSFFFVLRIENFAQCDANGDGEIDMAETLAALEKFKNESLTALNSNNYFSNDGNPL